MKMKLLSYGCFYCTRCSRVFNNCTLSVPIKTISSTSNKNYSSHQLLYLKKVHITHNKNIKGLEPYNFNYIRTSSFHSVIQAYTSAFQTLSESKAVAVSQKLLVSVHDNSGLPWWATIAVSTILLRFSVTFPLALYQHYILAKIENLKLELPAIVKEIQNEIVRATKIYNWSPRTTTIVYQRSLKKQWRLLIERDNCHPAKAGIVILFQLPMWILLSMSIRNLVFMRRVQDEAAEKIFDQLKSEGFLWIKDMTVPDDTMIISTALCLVSLAIIEVNRLSYTTENPTKLRRTLTVFFRLFAVITFPLGLIVPSCLSFYWLTSATVGLWQNLILLSPRIKLLFGIPKTPSTQANPYRHLLKQIKNRLPGTSKTR
ncbi:cytochrome c oxidase assembly protein COX18, mitochondrial [Lycorma delicatula]|uniref:cytochrome c oxidase assembly protein COX18, mitochondrial n=1 Tax=Lycorma delicatula TaxID=130591 RepID=UPI003F513EFB